MSENDDTAPEFWRAVFLAAFDEDEATVEYAARIADDALSAYVLRFPRPRNQQRPHD